MEIPAPANGLKLMLVIAFVFALGALYGQWQHLQRGKVETATVVAAPNVSPSASPNDR